MNILDPNLNPILPIVSDLYDVYMDVSFPNFVVDCEKESMRILNEDMRVAILTAIKTSEIISLEIPFDFESISETIFELIDSEKFQIKNISDTIWPFADFRYDVFSKIHYQPKYILLSVRLFDKKRKHDYLRR